MGYGPPNRPALDKIRVRRQLSAQTWFARTTRVRWGGAGGSAGCGGRCRSDRRHVLPLVPREDAERFGSQQVKALLAGTGRDVYLGAPRVADQNERGLRVTLCLLPQAQ
jgi:hypothetical protein